MITYQINYEAKNTYKAPVYNAHFNFLVLPCSDATQFLVNYNIENTFHQEGYRYRNIFGYDVISLKPEAPFTAMDFKVACTLKKKEIEPVLVSQLGPREELKVIKGQDFLIDHHLFLYPSELTRLHEKDIKKVLFHKQEISLVNFLHQLNDHIYNLFTYAPNKTNVYTTASEALETGEGVCQDYVHVFLAMARLNSIPARYVSGYLSPGPHIRDTIYMHAWVEAFVPGTGWLGFDPTNNLRVEKHYIKVAHGVDYQDCSPIKGILKASGSNETNYHVEVRHIEQ